MTEFKVRCPECRLGIDSYRWEGQDVVACPKCATEFELLLFPALTVGKPVAIASAVVPGEATCYFHPENRAERCCDGCGRFVCAVCDIPYGSEHLCPGCLKAGEADRKRGTKRLPENERVLYDRLAIAIAGLPLVVFPFTVITAPVAIGCVYWAWNRPGSLVTPKSRARLWIALVLALMEVAGWTIVLINLLMSRHPAVHR